MLSFLVNATALKHGISERLPMRCSLFLRECARAPLRSTRKGACRGNQSVLDKNYLAVKQLSPKVEPDLLAHEPARGSADFVFGTMIYRQQLVSDRGHKSAG